jgi:hypothetical protein
MSVIGARNGGLGRCYALVAALERQCRGKIAARRIASHHDACRVAANVAAVGAQPAQHREAVVEPGRERPFGGQPIVDADRDHANLERAPASDVGGVGGGAEREPAAVQIEQ